MVEFRRFVMGLAGLCAVFLIVASTIVGGFAGAATSTLVSGLMTGRPGPGNAVIGFLLGAASGFFFAALPAAMMFALMEIAENTRRTALLLGGAGTAHPVAQPPVTPQPPRLRVRPE
jgi:hypothetical protein